MHDHIETRAAGTGYRVPGSGERDPGSGAETNGRTHTNGRTPARTPILILGQGSNLRLVHADDLAADREARASGALVGLLLMLAFGWLSGLATAWVVGLM